MKSLAASQPIRAVVYRRVSTNEQAEADKVARADGQVVTRETSLDTQEAACRAFTEGHGWHVEAVFSDTFSGHSLFERPGLSDLRARVAAGGIDHVVAYVVGPQAARLRAVPAPRRGDDLSAADLADTRLLPSKACQQPGCVGGAYIAHIGSITKVGVHDQA